LKRAIPFIIGLLGIVLIAAAACGGDDESAPPERPRGTTAAVATSAPPTKAPATTAPTKAPEPAAPTEAPASSGGDASAGPSVFAAKGCVACHTIQGLSGAVGQIGPELTNLATSAASRVAGESADAYIREAIEDPPAFVVDGFAPIMPATIRSTMNDTEFEDLVAYLLTLN
jgi:mono/diheme cytochrome c family protein